MYFIVIIKYKNYLLTWMIIIKWIKFKNKECELYIYIYIIDQLYNESFGESDREMRQWYQKSVRTHIFIIYDRKVDNGIYILCMTIDKYKQNKIDN